MIILLKLLDQVVEMYIMLNWYAHYMPGTRSLSSLVFFFGAGQISTCCQRCFIQMLNVCRFVGMDWRWVGFVSQTASRCSERTLASAITVTAAICSIRNDQKQTSTQRHLFNGVTLRTGNHYFAQCKL